VLVLLKTLEGLLTRLLGLDGKWDSVAAKAKELFTFHIVPNVNPDGSINGEREMNNCAETSSFRPNLNTSKAT